MRRDDPKIPSPQRTLESDGPRRSAPPLDAAGREDEEGDDENTWAASGSPYLSRERTAEVSYYEDSETHIEWGASASGPMGEDTLNFDAPPSHGHGHGDGAPTDYPSEPGIVADGSSLSALRDAMRSGPSARRSSPGPLPIPAPRARAQGQGSPSKAIRPLPPVRRVGPPVEPPSAPGRARPGAPPPTRRRAPSLAAWAGPVAAGVFALGFGGILFMANVRNTPEVAVEAPMLPVIGGPAPKSVPAPPFDLAAPTEYRSDLLPAGVPLDELPTLVVEARAAGDHVRAAALGDRLVRTERRPNMYFGLAVLLSEVGEVDAALYWLVKAVQDHGVPPEWLVDRRAFRHLWVDARWDDLVRWTTLAKRHHAERGANPATIVLPTSLEAASDLDAERASEEGRKQRARRDSPTLPVLVWLDDVGGNGSSVLAWGQAVADELGVIVVGLGGPERIGPAGSWWTSDPARDREHVENALAAVPNAVPDPTRRYLVGVGQGGQYAVELLLRDTSFASAAFAIAPTADWTGARDKLEEGRSHSTQSALLSAGALTPETHTLVRLDLGRLKRAEVTATMVIDDAPWPWPEELPPDLGERVQDWLGGRLSPEAESTESMDPATSADPEVVAEKATPASPPANP